MFNSFPIKMTLLYSVYRWCCDNNYTPCLLLVWRNSNNNNVSSGITVNNANSVIVINISRKAVRNLTIATNSMTLLASFRGQLKEITICAEDILSVYSLETGEGVLLCDYPLLSSSRIIGHQRCILEVILET